MKILVCITKAPDTTTKVQFTDNNTAFQEEGVQWILNPYDEWYALVRALELKEAGTASSVSLISVGDASVEPIIRKALALGGDEAVRIKSSSADSFNIAHQIAQYAKENAFELVLCGKESIDYNNASVGAMIAELMDVQYVGHATKLEVNGNELSLDREIQGGSQSNTTKLPCVISCSKGMAEARIPNMRGIMAARTKPLNVVEANDESLLTSIVSYEVPEGKTGVKLVESGQEEQLVELLHSEAKVI